MLENEKHRLAPRLQLERQRGAAMTEKSREKEQDGVSEGKSPWPMYEPDARTYVSSFSVRFPDAATLSDRFHELHEAGEKVVVVDLCGVADASSLGADHTVCLTLKQWPDHAPGENQTVIEGDVFETGAIERVIDAVRQNGGKIHCAFMRPVGGLAGHGHNMRSHLRLYSALQKLYANLADGGDIYIELVGFQGMPMLSSVLNAQSPVPIAEDKRTEKTKGYFTDSVHIKKIAGAPDTLLPIGELEKDPVFSEQFQVLLAE